MKPRCGVAFAAVSASAVRAGIMASSSGSAKAAPAPRNTVRRVKCFLLTNISMTPSSLPRGDLLEARLLHLDRFHLARLELRRHDNPFDNRRKPVVVARSILHDLADLRHVIVLNAAAQRIG